MLTRRNKRLILVAVGLLVFAGFVWGAAIRASAPAVVASIGQKVVAVKGAFFDTGKVKKTMTTNDDQSGSPAPAPEGTTGAKAPVPQPEWLGMQRAKMSDGDHCFRLRGLQHNICKCWSKQTWADGRGISRWIYHWRGRCE